MVTLESVSKIYRLDKNEIKAINNISYQIKSEIVTAVTGKSGSGKSTLLHLIGGLDDVTFGKIKIDSTEITSLSERELNRFRRENIGFVFQFFNLVQELTVSENIKLAQQICKVKTDKEYFTELISVLELQDRLNHLPGQLSGGQRQRVAIARALISKPKLLLLDEPTGNLDTVSSEMVIDMLLNLKKRLNQTVIIVTHDADIAKRADSVITLSNGEIIEEHSNV